MEARLLRSRLARERATAARAVQSLAILKAPDDLMDPGMMGLLKADARRFLSGADLAVEEGDRLPVLGALWLSPSASLGGVVALVRMRRLRAAAGDGP